MNQRIKELADQAELTIRDSRGNTYMSHPEFNKKFAQLIIRECIEVIDGTSDNTKLMRVEPYQKIIWAIEEHFGIEE